MLRRVYGHSTSDAVDHLGSSQHHHHPSINITTGQEPDSSLKSKTPTHYNLQVALDQIRIIGLNPQELLNRESPTLYLSLWIQHSFLTSSSTSPTHETSSESSSSSSSSPFTISLQYSSSTSSWQSKSDPSHSLPTVAHHHFSLVRTYSHCLLMGELWYKSFLTRKKRHLGVLQYPLAGLDTNETKIIKHLDVVGAEKDFKKKIEEENIVIEVQIAMRLTRR